MIEGYYNRFNPAKNYESHLFRAGKVLQSAELAEVQSALQHRLQGVADALFKDGDVIRDARIIVDADTGSTTCESGALYLKGAVRGVAPSTFTLPTVGIVTVGIYLKQSVVTELEDPALRDPASGSRNYEEPGAARLKLDPVWGHAGDGQTGEFYPVYTVENAIVRSKEPPPQLDSVTQAIARYDRDNSGGSYVVSGLHVAAAADLVSGEQVYTVSEGRARVNGYPIEATTGRRVVYDTEPDLRFIESEPHTSTTVGAQRIDLDRTPVGEITQVRITAEKTVTLTHGGFTGAQDLLPDTSVLAILDVHQDATTYVNGTDYKLTAGKVDWSLGGAEVAPGSTYSVTYQYINTVAPTAIDETGFTVTGAVVGSLVLTSYNQKLPRIDRLCKDADGAFIWIKGVAADWNPAPPMVPSNLLPIASVYQTWGNDRRVVNDGVRTVSMMELTAINSRLDWIAERLAEQRLQSDIGLRESGTKRGLFVDPFVTDEQRDAGIAQTAAIVGGELTLRIAATVSQMGADIVQPTTAAFTLTPILEQTLRTGSMKVNPYQAFTPIPAKVTLTPAVDRWTEVNTSWAGQITSRFTLGAGDQSSVSSQTVTATLAESRSNLERLRPIEVRFNIEGFGPNEQLATVTFDGVPVTPVAP